MKKLGFGCMRFPLLDENSQTAIDKVQVCAMIDEFIKQGFTYFDTAYIYHNGTSEETLKECLVQRHPRTAFTIATKMPMFKISNYADHQQIFNEQLARCGIDFFDYYLLHNLGVANYAIAQKFDSFRFIKELKNQGKARKIGFSFHDKAEVLDEILSAHAKDIDFVQLQINYLDWESNGIESRKCYEVAVKHDLPVVVMEPIKGGNLINLPPDAQTLFKTHAPTASPASWAIRFAASLPNVLVVLSGMSNFEQMAENTSYMKEFNPLSQEEIALCNQAAQIINRASAIPCTACEYCTETCPQNISIPKYFHLYNDKKNFFKATAANPNFSIQDVYYENLAQNFGKASDCISCKVCEEKCPQHIEISQELKRVAESFEY